MPFVQDLHRLFAQRRVVWGRAVSLKFFLEEAHKLYRKRESYENDMQYAYFACRSIVKYISDCIARNTKAVYSEAIA